VVTFIAVSGRKQLRDRGEMADLGALVVDELRGRVDHRPGRGGLRLHVRDHELDPLELGDRLAELLALLRVRDRVVERSLGDAQRLRRDSGARTVQHLHRDPEPLAFLAEAVRGRYHHLVQLQLRGVAAPYPELAVDGGRAESLEMLCVLEDEGAHSPGTLGRVGLGEDGDRVGDAATGDPDLAGR